MATDTESLVLSISAETAQIRRALKQLQKSFDDLKPPKMEMPPQASRSMKALQADAKNLTFQLNDIATSLAGGMSPFQVMMQQGSQVSQVLTGAGGIKGAITALGSAFMGLLNPVSLVTSAVIFAAGAAVQYFTSTEDGADDANEALKEQAKVLGAIKERWGDLIPGLNEYIERVTKAVDAASKFEAFQTLIADALAEVSKQAEVTEQDILGLEMTLIQAGQSDAAATLRQAWEAYNKEIQAGRKGTEQMAALQKAVKAAADTGVSGVDALVNRINALVSSVRDAQVNVEELGRLFGGLPQNLGGAGPPGAGLQEDIALEGGTRKQIEFLKTKAANQQIAESLDRLDAEMATALVELFKKLPDTARITSGVRTYEEQERLYRAYKEGRGGLAGKPGPGGSRHQFGRAVDIGQGVDMETLRQAVTETEKLETLKGKTYEVDKVHVQLAGTANALEKENAEIRVDAEKKAADAAEKEAEANERRDKALADYLSSLNEELSLETRIAEIKMSGMTEEDKARAIAVETELQKALNLAKDQDRTLTEAQIAQIRAVTIARTDANLATNAYTDAQKKNTDAIKQFNQQIAGAAQTAVSGLVNDLRNGVEAGEAFNNMLNRIIDSLIQMTLQSLFNPAGGGGGLGDFIGQLFGVAHKGGLVGSTAFPTRKVSPLVFAGAQRFASGGMVGLRSGEVPIIAHRGEMVIPRNMVGRGGGGKVDNSVHQDNKISIDMSGAGYVAGNSENARQVGENIQKIIQAELVRESRPGGLLRKIP